MGMRIAGVMAGLPFFLLFQSGGTCQSENNRPLGLFLVKALGAIRKQIQRDPQRVVGV
jgi:hypothetical protein